MQTAGFADAELEDSWLEGDETARWRTSAGYEGAVTGCALLEADPGRRLPPHTDSAEEAIVVVAGRARVTVGDESFEIAAGNVAVVPAEARHQVESVGDEPLRFVALYGASEVTTTYDEPVQPDGERRRDAF